MNWSQVISFNEHEGGKPFDTRQSPNPESWCELFFGFSSTCNESLLGNNNRPHKHGKSWAVVLRRVLEAWHHVPRDCDLWDLHILLQSPLQRRLLHCHPVSYEDPLHCRWSLCQSKEETNIIQHRESFIEAHLNLNSWLTRQMWHWVSRDIALRNTVTSSSLPLKEINLGTGRESKEMFSQHFKTYCLISRFSFLSLFGGQGPAKLPTLMLNSQNSGLDFFKCCSYKPEPPRPA